LDPYPRLGRADSPLENVLHPAAGSTRTEALRQLSDCPNEFEVMQSADVRNDARRESDAQPVQILPVTLVIGIDDQLGQRGKTNQSMSGLTQRPLVLQRF
jgi:hypothetical protein